MSWSTASHSCFHLKRQAQHQERFASCNTCKVLVLQWFAGNWKVWTVTQMSGVRKWRDGIESRMTEAICRTYIVFLQTNRYLYKGSFLTVFFFSNYIYVWKRKRSRLAAYIINAYALRCLCNVSELFPARSPNPSILIKCELLIVFRARLSWRGSITNNLCITHVLFQVAFNRTGMFCLVVEWECSRVQCF